MNIEVVPPSTFASSSSSDDERKMSGGDNDEVEYITYNKREAFFNKLPLIERRMNQSKSSAQAYFHAKANEVYLVLPC